MNKVALGLKTTPLLVIYSNDPFVKDDQAFVKVKDEGNQQLLVVFIRTNHGYNDHRIAL